MYRGIGCPSFDDLQRFVDGRCGEIEKQVIDMHASICAESNPRLSMSCRQRIESMRIERVASARSIAMMQSKSFKPYKGRT